MSPRICIAVIGALFSLSALAATPKDTLVVAKNIDDIVSLDPAEAFEFSGGEVVANIYEPLVRYDPKDPTRLKPALAATWKPAADGKSIEFSLRKNAVFESGNPVRPEDVLFSYRRVLRLNKAPASILSQLGWTPDNIEQMVRKTSAGTLVLGWSGEFGPAYVLNVLAARPGAIVDEKLVLQNEKAGDLGNQWLTRNSAGSGPYKLKLYKPKEVLLLEANKQAANPPKTGNVLIKSVTEPATQRLLIESGDADIVRDLGSDQIDALKARPDIRLEDFPAAAVHFIALNLKNEKLRNPAIWDAMRYLVDYDGISGQLLKGQMRTHQAFLPVGFAGALTTTPYKLDAERAKAILAKAGINGLEIDMDVINSPRFMDMAQSMQASMAKAGIKLNLLPGTGSQVITRYRARKHEAILLYWGPDFFDPHSNAKSFAYNVDNSDGAYQSTTTWRNSWLVPELSAKTLAALKEADPAKRATAYQNLQKEVQARSPFVIAFQEQNRVALRSNVKGYVQGSVADLVQYDGVTK
ncbi:ABC transporter substrate-binding protein [Variovorax sp. KBW07]|uniref:ABC transporter substrate-binding protein n=1 Tax=Variovorax sp. KBW07 TaxID=2153358 RepID=UPI000F565BF0|nr:ABC transporter substrate-binding protein [Variovorax sp. KBW07]RQO62714.1 ABC transporter substrate-binding protein [Variovorax sp. KBW07]